MENKKEYIYLIKLVRKPPTEEDEKIMEQHFMYLKENLDKGVLLLAGPCLDLAFGVAIYYASSDEEAEEFMKNDPAVINNVVTAEYHPFKISLLNK